jgi:hypothetical protein
MSNGRADLINPTGNIDRFNPFYGLMDAPAPRMTGALTSAALLYFQRFRHSHGYARRMSGHAQSFINYDQNISL